MKKIILILIVFCSCFLFTSLLSAQNRLSSKFNYSDLAAWYKITDEEAEEILLSEREITDETLLHTLIAIVPEKEGIPKKKELKGYCLKITAHKEDLKVKLVPIHSISAQILNHQKGFSIRVVDSLGVLLKDAKVNLDNKTIPFNEVTKTHLLKKNKTKGTLKITALGETIFYDISNRDYSRRKPFFYTQFGKIVKSPYTLVSSGWWRLKNLFRGRKSYKRKKYQGYIACNQPKYQPLDTVKIKAFITNKSGKPLTKALEARLNIAYEGKVLWKKTVEPNQPGNYTLEFVLGDSLQLDKQYLIAFYEVSKSRSYRTVSQLFGYEDYELNSIQYSFRSDKEKYESTDSIQLHLSAKYKTGMYAPDVSVKLVARTHVLDYPLRLSNFQANEVLVKDTIWTHQQALNASDTTLIYLPLSTIPKSDSEIWVEAEFTDSSGELQEQSLAIEVKQKQPNVGCLNLRLEGAYVIAECIEEGKSVPKAVDFEVFGGASEVWSEYEVTLPYQERLNSSVGDYTIYKKDKGWEVSLYPEDFKSNVEVFGNRANDSIRIQIQNPRQIPVYYGIYEGKRLVEQGETEQESFIWKQKDIGQEAYFIQYSYLWSDEPIEDSERFFYPKNNLDINIDQAQNIRPGEEVQVKLKVTDRNKKAVQRVNLVAGAVNGQFEEFSNFSGPYLRQKTHKNPKKTTDIELDILNYDSGRKDLTRAWFERLQLKQKLYYQLRFPSNGVFMQSDSIEEIAPKDTFYREVAQFAPYLVKNGKEQPIYLIYCNSQLVYYYQANKGGRYSFLGQEGYNQIEIRSKNFTYIMDSVLLKKGHKLTFSIDENQYLKFEKAKDIRRLSTQPEFSDKELNLLKTTIFELEIPSKNAGSYYVLQDAWNVQRLNGTYGNFLLGPFYPNTRLILVRTDYFQNNFLFEGGFRYQITRNKERLYESKLFEKPFKLPNQIAHQPIGGVLFHPKDIVIQSPLSSIDYDSTPNNTTKGYGIYKFEYLSPKELEDDLMAVMILHKDSTYGVYEKDAITFENLPPDDYQLCLVKESGEYLQKDFKIEANTLTFQRIDSTEAFTIDSNYQFLKKKLQKRFVIDLPFSLEPKAKKYSQSEINRMKGNGTGGVNGQIVDKDSSEPLIGVNVIVKGTTIGTVTDIDGFYRLDLNEGNYTIEISYVGYETTTMDIIVTTYGYQEFNAELEEGKYDLDEIVVVGYGNSARKRREVVISASQKLETANTTVTAELVERTPETSITGIYGNRAYNDSLSDFYIDGIKVRGLSALEKNKEKTVQLRSNFSDYAYWQPTLLTDQNGEAYFNVTFPDNTTQWKTFVLGMNDREQGGFASTITNAYKDIMAELSLPRFLIEGDKTHIIGKSLNYTGDSINIQTSFKIGEELLQSNSTRIKEFLVEKAKVVAPLASKQDSLNLTYSLEMQDGYGDGEQRQIPILKKGIEETVGEFYALEKDTTIQFSFNENLGEIHLYVQNNVFDLLQNDLDYLQNYPYGCNEQNASRLMAFLMDKEIKAHFGQPFRQEKALNKTIKKLLKTQNSNGTWGWWQGNSFNLWMTLYVHKALKKAKLAGYSAGSDEWTVRYLVNLLPQLKGRDLLKVLSHLNEINLNFDYEKYLQKADSTLANPQLYDRLKMLQIRQRMKLSHDLQWLDSLRQQTTFGNYFWGKQGYGLHDNAIQNTLLAFDIYQRANRTADCQKIIGYFLARRGRKCWRNTFETAQILQAILPTLLEQSGGELTENQLVFSGAFDQTISEFPFEAKLSVNKPLQIQKTGSTPLYFTAYQSFWNSEPQSKSDVFAVQTTWENTQNEEVQSLKAAEKATLKVDIEVKESAEYVMIEVPIPAGCSYGNKGEKTHLHEVHREYFKEKVAIFCRELPIGKHTFEVPLEARYTGDYTVNPTKVEQMYFPVFYGQNEVGEVEIK